jgi:aminoglycoside 3-N-acetyltransferase
MSGEFSVVNNTKEPNTINTLCKDLKDLGVKEGSVVLLHSSLSSLGWTVGGAVAMIKAFQKVLTQNGTLIMPCFSSGNTDPYKWENPPVPKEWWPIIRKHIPAYNPLYTPTRGIGIIPEVFRKFPKVHRSMHPISSFTAWGQHAEIITKDHELEADLGENSPLSRIYDLNGYILLLGVTHSTNTSLHLAEYRSNYPSKGYYHTGSAMFVNGKRKWVEWKSLDHKTDDFEEIGRAFEEKINYKPKKVGLAISRLLSQPEIIDFAIKWMKTYRK